MQSDAITIAITESSKTMIISIESQRFGIRDRLFQVANLLVIGCLIIGTTALAAEQYPVQWLDYMKSDHISQNDQEEWNAWLSQPWQEDDGTYVSFELFDKHLTEKIAVKNCEQMFAADKKDMNVRGTGSLVLPERNRYRGWRLKCYAARVIAGAAGAQTSLVADFLLDEAHIRALPVEIAPIGGPTGPTGMENVDRIKSQGGSLGDYIDDNPDFLIDFSASESGKVVIRGDDTPNSFVDEILWLARGDFNHDGSEDLLLATNFYYPGPVIHTQFYRLFIVTRKDADGPLILAQEVAILESSYDWCYDYIDNCSREINY